MDKPRLIASDVDGTLLDPLEGLSARTKKTVRAVTEDAVPFVLVSGRPPRWIPTLAESAGLSGYAVCANGAVLYDVATDRVLESWGLDPVLLADVASALTGVLPGCRLAAERIGRSARDERVRSFVIEHDFHNPWGDDSSVTTTRGEVLGEYAVKLLVSMADMSSDEMAEAARAVLADSVDVTFSSGAGLIEIAARGISKASGLASVAERLGVNPRHTIAFGDMPNDLEMLRWAGHGVAVANAHPEVLKAADEITAPNSEDGVAQVLERWFH